MAEVKYQGPVTIHKMIDPVPGPSFEDQANAMPKRDKLIQICQSDEMFTWMHALATILVINEKAVLGGLKVSEQLRVWQDRIRILKKPPWIFAPLNMCRTIDNTSWEEAMTARPEMGTDGLLTIAIGHGPTYRLLPKITSFFGIIAGLFKKLWDQPEMHETLETDDNFEIVASTTKAIYDQTCRTCGVNNRRRMASGFADFVSSMTLGIRRPSRDCSAPSSLTNVTLKMLVLFRTSVKRKTGPLPSKPGKMAHGGTPRIGALHPARGAGTDTFPE